MRFFTRSLTVAAAIAGVLLVPEKSNALSVDSSTPAFELYLAMSEDGTGFDCGMYFLQERKLPSERRCKSVADKMSVQFRVHGISQDDIEAMKGIERDFIRLLLDRNRDLILQRTKGNQ